jgi:FkbM family methyltransferase
MQKLSRLGKDFIGLVHICGPLIALRWLFYVHFYVVAIMRARNLQAADRAMGAGPFTVTLKPYKCRFKIMGPGCISGIREMYVRDTYLQGGWLDIRADDTVLDLGANMGNFTNLALALEPTVRVIAVEPNISWHDVFVKSVNLNLGHLARTTLIPAVLGELTEKFNIDPNYIAAERLSEEQLLERVNVPRIDFIKCDIEGGEFALLNRKSKLLVMARALACEVHAAAGSINGFIAEIEAAGFTIGPSQHAAGGGSATFVAKREGAPQATDGLSPRAETSSR